LVGVVVAGEGVLGGDVIAGAGPFVVKCEVLSIRVNDQHIYPPVL